MPASVHVFCRLRSTATGARGEDDACRCSRYLCATHRGPYDALEEATGQFLTWAAEHGQVFDVRPGDDGDVWGCRLEHYLTDPAAEPDPQRWETVLEFRLRD